LAGGEGLKLEFSCNDFYKIVTNFGKLAVTNMFVEVNRRVILDEFKILLSKYIDDKQQIREEHEIWYYGKVGLCTRIT